MRKSVKYKQEWDRFKSLCPEEIMKELESEFMSEATYAKIINMFYELGFGELYMDFILSKDIAEYTEEKILMIKSIYGFL